LASAITFFFKVLGYCKELSLFVRRSMALCSTPEEQLSAMEAALQQIAAKADAAGKTQTEMLPTSASDEEGAPISAAPASVALAAAMPAAHADATVVAQKTDNNKRKFKWQGKGRTNDNEVAWRQDSGKSRDDRQHFEKPHPVMPYPND
jgi:hypothetical protein